MRRIHVIGIAVVSLLTVGSVARAQSATPGVPRAGQRSTGRFERGRGRLLRGIKLSEAEKARVKEIRGRYQTESKTLRESGDRQKLAALKQRERSEIRTALTPEHQTQFDANVTQRAERRAERRKEKGHGPRKADRLGTSKS